jgi:hypothetical protein
MDMMTENKIKKYLSEDIKVDLIFTLLQDAINLR